MRVERLSMCFIIRAAGNESEPNVQLSNACKAPQILMPALKKIQTYDTLPHQSMPP